MNDSFASNDADPVSPSDHDLSLDRPTLKTDSLDFERPPQEAALFAIGNGFLGIHQRKHDPKLASAGLGASVVYINGVYERRPIKYHEAAHGYPSENDLRIPVWDCMELGIEVDGREMQSAGWRIVQDIRELGYRTGLLSRKVTLARDGPEEILLELECFASMKRRGIVAHKIVVSSRTFSGSIALQALISHPFDSAPSAEEVLESDIYDPRIGPAMSENPWRMEISDHEGNTWTLLYRTLESHVAVATIDRLLSPAGDPEGWTSPSPDARFGQRLRLDLSPGQAVELHRLTSYETDRGHASEDLLESCRQQLNLAEELGYDALKREQFKDIALFCERAFVSLPENRALENAINLNTVHLSMAAGRDGQSSVAAKGQTGEGYEGHVFWDAEIFMLPFFNYTQPDIARSMLEYRHSMLDHAKEIARTMGHSRGALYPWRTISGIECSSFFPAGTAQYHINADIAYAVQQYMEANDDLDFLCGAGIELLVETARIWPEAGFFNARKGGAFCLNRVTGPDEYSALVDNNLYTNVMVKGHLEYALHALDAIREKRPDGYDAVCQALEISPEETGLWRRIASNMYLPFSSKEGIHLQDEHFLDKEVWDFENTPPDKYPLLLHYHPLTIYRYQVCKQADAVLAMFLKGNDFLYAHRESTLRYYEAITTHDSSLSLGTFAILWAEFDELEKAYQYLSRTAFVDIENLYKNSDQGLHMAALANSWSALAFGFAGMRTYGGRLSFRPKYFAPLGPYCLRIKFRGRLIQVTVTSNRVAYELLEGEPAEFSHDGTTWQLKSSLSFAKVQHSVAV